MAFTETENVPPAFVMEEAPRVDRLAGLIAANDEGGQDSIRNDIYVIRTVSGDSQPIVDHEVKRIGPKKDTKWNNLVGSLKGLGVERILIGGMFLSLPGGEPSACVGHAINHLENDFQLELSNLTYDFHAGEESYERKRSELKNRLKTQK